MKKRYYRLWMTCSRSVNVDTFAFDSEKMLSTPQKKLRLMQHIRRSQEAIKKGRLVVLGALFLDKFDKQFQVFRIHIGQDTVAEVKYVAGMLGMLTE